MKGNRIIKAFIFDMDGVLTHRYKLFSERLEEQFGIPLEMTLPFFTGIFQLCLVGKADLKEEVIKYFPVWGWNKSVEDLLYYWFNGERTVDTKMVSYVKFLKKQGFTVLLGTNNEKYRTKFIRRELGFDAVFDKVYGSGDIGYMKPDHGFYTSILADQQLKPEEVFFWDDDRGNIAAAKELGIRSEHFTTIADFEEKMEKFLQ